MTRKDYESIASALRNARINVETEANPEAEDTRLADYQSGVDDTLAAVVAQLSAAFALDNPRFDPKRFHTAALR